MNVDTENVVTTVENETVQDTAQFSSEDTARILSYNQTTL